MIWLDWTKEGWRVFKERPAYAKNDVMVALLPHDVLLPAGRTLLLHEPSGPISHGYIELPCEVSDLAKVD